jgi:hypothetical protein
MCADVARNATHRAGHCAARQPTAVLSCAGACSIPEQRTYQQVMSQTRVPRGRAAALVLSHMTENRKVEARKPLIFRHTIFTFGLKKATVRQNRFLCHDSGYRLRGEAGAL